MSAVPAAPLEKVSVVLMASAAAFHPSALNPLARSLGRAAVIFPSARNSPITPVEAMNTCFRGQPKSFAAAATVRPTEATPGAPVKALALPELTTIARTLPPASAPRHHCTGAEAIDEVVNTPPTVVPGASSASMRSSRPR